MRTKPRDISPKAKVVYNFILTYKAEHDGNSPSIREIVVGTGITSTSVVSYYLDRLVEHNMITVDFDAPGKARNITIPGGRWLPPNGIY